MKVTKSHVIKPAIWRAMDQSQKEYSLTCNCKHGGVQDMCHLVYECGWLSDTVDGILTDTRRYIQPGEHRRKYDSLTRTQQITCSLSALQIPNVQKTGSGRQTQINNVHKLWGVLYEDLINATQWL